MCRPAGAFVMGCCDVSFMLPIYRSYGAHLHKNTMLSLIQQHCERGEGLSGVGFFHIALKGGEGGVTASHRIIPQIFYKKAVRVILSWLLYCNI